MSEVFDITNFTIDHVLRGIMVSPSTGDVIWSINQITDPSLSISTDEASAVDALGTPIATYNRAKSAQFSANNSVFDLGLYAAQQGKEKEVATEAKKITTPAFETITVPNDPENNPVKLAHVPNAIPTKIYLLKNDDTFGEKLEYSATKADGKFVYTTTDASEDVEATASITFPATATVGAEYFVQYEYDATRAVAVTGDAINFPKAGKFVMEVLGANICNQEELVHAYIVFPNAKLDANVDISFTTDGNHPFTLKANQQYCDRKKILFQIIVPDEE